MVKSKAEDTGVDQVPAARGQTVVELSPREGALQVWSEIARSLRVAGYQHAGPEYLRLSRMLVEARSAELLNGQFALNDDWNKLRAKATEALELLQPLVDAARMLANLPDTFLIVSPWEG